MSQHTPQSIAEHVAGRVVGVRDLVLSGLAQITAAQPGQLTFVGESGWAPRWAGSQASAAVVTEGIALEPGDGRALIFVKDADLAMVRVLSLFAPPPVRPEAGIHPTAVISEQAVVGRDVSVGPYCVIRPGARVGDGSVLHAHVCLMDDTEVGSDCVLWPHVVVRERCVVGDRCVLEPGVVIGADGFGYRGDVVDGKPRIVKVPHLGNVVLGNDVELGANTTVDRGKFDATTIGDGSKLDNQVQVGHNCKIGRLVVISGCTAIAGSVTIGDGAMIGGGTIIRDHITIGRGCKLAGGSAVADNVPDGEDWAGYPAQPAKDTFRQVMAVKRLPDLIKKVKGR